MDTPGSSLVHVPRKIEWLPALNPVVF